jgi:D-alanyl-D-alanine carboxypeptidase (penicillin-binding protein 5/6)
MNFRFGDNYNFTDAQNAEIVVGQTNLTYEDLLYALMIYSACDAANILAYSVAGTIGEFVRMMNEKADELGCVNTNFSNPHGLHERDNYSCAWDMFLISRYAYEKYPIFRDLSSKLNHRMPANSRNAEGVTLPNTNRMLHRDSSYFYPPVSGIKTGSLGRYLELESGEFHPGHFNLVSVASQGSHTYMLVTLGAPFHDVPGDRGFYTYNDHLALYRWAFDKLEYQMILSSNDIVAQGGVRDGMEDRIQLRAASDFSYLLPANLDRSAVLRQPTLNFHDMEEQVFVAPIERGEVLGYVELVLAGEVLTRIDLIAVTDVQPSLESQVADRLWRFFFGTSRNSGVDADGNPIDLERGFPFGLTLSLIVIILIFFVIMLRIANSERAKERRSRNAGLNSRRSNFNRRRNNSNRRRPRR